MTNGADRAILLYTTQEPSSELILIGPKDETYNLRTRICEKSNTQVLGSGAAPADQPTI
jgi:hypothetical protein